MSDAVYVICSNYGYGDHTSHAYLRTTRPEGLLRLAKAGRVEGPAGPYFNPLVYLYHPPRIQG